MVRSRPHGEPPAELTKNKGRWTKRWCEIVKQRKSREWATPKAKKILRKALVPLTHRKCAYCETRLGVSDHATIDHYVAKSVSPEHAFEWGNLLPSCPLCNQTKSNEDHCGRLIRPHEEDPEEYFWLTLEGKLEPSPRIDDPVQLERCLETIRMCGLNRGGLCESRYLVMVDLKQLLLQPRDDAVAASIEPHLDARRPYKLVIRRILEDCGLTELAEEDRRRFSA